MRDDDGIIGRLFIDLVDSDVWVIVVMQADRRVVDLTEIEQLVETALKQLPVHQKHIDPVSCLDDLQGKVAVVVEDLFADYCTVM